MKQIILLITLLITFSIQAQEKLNFNLNGENIEFTISQEELYVEYEASQKSSIQRIANDEFEGLTNNSAILKMKDLKGTYQERKQRLKGKVSTDFQRVEPVLIYKDGTRQIAKGELSVKLKANASLNEIFKDLDFTFQPNEFEKNLFLVKLDLETSKLLLLVNQLQNDNRIEFIEPNFLRLIKTHTNDPFFNNQWSINNQGYLGGTVDADMDVEEAWSYSTGNNIVVAVIDEGVDLIHPDLTANLLPGFDATGNGSNGAPNEANNDAHGTACAGIIAAIADNTTGTVGIAYNARILPVRIAFSNGLPLGDINRAWITNDNWIANGINWAWQNGADVLSNSWGGGSPSSTITIAINNAVNNGRVDANGNPRGSVVLFSSGNDPGGNGNAVSFPANLENVISVGASSMCDTRKDLSSCDGEFWGSNFGSSLDIIAPGVQIYTTDISGSNGYRFGDYISNFNGTSSACPNAAGVVALILSADPNLTQQEARGILERNTDKVNGYSYSNTSGQPNRTWNSEVGYGRINALKAVGEAQGVTISGPDLICSGSSYTYTLQNPPSTVTWNTGSEVTVISQTNSSITVQASGINVRGSGFVEINGGSARKDFYVGKPYANLPQAPNICTSQFSDPYTLPASDGADSYHLVSSSPYLKIDGQNDVTYSSAPALITFTSTQAGTYLVELFTTNGCGISRGAMYVTSERCGGPGGFLISPNPSSSEINIKSTKDKPSATTSTQGVVYKGIPVIAKLFDFNGTFIKEIELDPYGTTKMDVSSLKEGFYFLKIQVRGEEETYKIIVAQ